MLLLHHHHHHHLFASKNMVHKVDTNIQLARHTRLIEHLGSLPKLNTQTRE